MCMRNPVPYWTDLCTEAVGLKEEKEPGEE